MPRHECPGGHFVGGGGGGGTTVPTTPTRAKYLNLVIFHVPTRSPSFSILKVKVCITLFSKHYCKWSRMDVPSVLKCKYCGFFPSTTEEQ